MSSLRAFARYPRAVVQHDITRRQRKLAPIPPTPRTFREFRTRARWWDLEAKRGYASDSAARRYASNMRWAAELALAFGPGTWLELLARSGHANPEPV